MYINHCFFKKEEKLFSLFKLFIVHPTQRAKDVARCDGVPVQVLQEDAHHTKWPQVASDTETQTGNHAGQWLWLIW